ncbi:MAG: hypothetical protein JWQ90_5155 [Hydrocarboniphaga sp.]|uniref:HvfB family MNIO-type RiPP peptide maturase n=1 Tax=Hydrocarboniphaga sp. TaxID=2033016 RepID=UPI0026103873|nr:DUF692 domain-containing protein [Hydrocarboniphaga sp.]MDB5972705.1 hypothetical protein [Hydrocarboniphaga sp.]
MTVAAGLGLRRALLDPLAQADEALGAPDFLEAAPENWMEVGGALGRRFRALSERYPLRAHGLALSIGGPAPLDLDWLRRLRGFLDAHDIADYSDHLSFCSDDGQLYELLPLPFTDEAVEHLAGRVAIVQDVLERTIALENISAYARLPGELSEAQFLNAVIERADCDLVLDVNNVYVNAMNHGEDASALIDSLPLGRVRGLHVAGHQLQADGLRIDTHGEAVIAPVWALLDHAYARFGVLPTVLERDFNLPPWPQLLAELQTLRAHQARAMNEPMHV